MSKGNLFLGFGRGKVGDVVFSHVNGEQVARARNRSPRNPQTPLQLLQRVVMKTASLGFSTLQDICNHSFQGRNGTTENQARFIERNIAQFRAQLAEIINSGDPEEILTSSESNFSAKGDSLAAMMPYQVSEGTLPSMGMYWYNPESQDYSGDFVVGPSVSSDPSMWTYNDLVSKLGVQRGDQLTILELYCDDTEEGAQSVYNGFAYGRFIVEPNDGDMTHEIADPQYENPRNMGGFYWYGRQMASNKYYAAPYISGAGKTAGRSKTTCAMALILSREVGGVWARSTEFIALRPDTVGANNGLSWDHHEALLSDAIASYMTDTSSLLYLNQAEV